MLGGYPEPYFVEIALMAGSEVVESHHPLVEPEQGFQQIGAYEAGYPGDKPGSWGRGELVL
ncbi:hypothetical protein D3C75_503140 [compost metagenome]